MINQGAPSRTHHNAGYEARGRKYKMTSKQVREADHLLQGGSLDLQGKVRSWESLASKIGAKVSRNTIYNTMRVALDHGKRLACVKEYQSDISKE